MAKGGRFIVDKEGEEPREVKPSEGDAHHAYPKVDTEHPRTITGADGDAAPQAEKTPTAANNEKGDE